MDWVLFIFGLMVTAMCARHNPTTRPGAVVDVAGIAAGSIMMIVAVLINFDVIR